PLGKATRFTAAAEDALAAGRAGHALWLLDHAARAGPEDQLNGRITRLRGEVELRGGVVAHAYDTLVAAATRLSATAPAEALQSLAAAGEAAGYAGDAAKVVALGGLARSIESPAERDEDRILRDILWGGSELFGGRVAEGMTLLNSAISAWESAACPQDDPRLLARLALAATLAGADVKAHTIAHVAVEAATRMGAVAVVPHALEYLVASEVFRGAYESAQSHAVQGIGIAETTGQVNSGCHLRANLALVAAFRGDERVCRSQSALAMRQATAHGLGLPAAVASWALGMIDLAANRTAAASQRLLDLSSAGPGAGHPVIAMLSIPHLVEALVRHDPSDVSVARAAASVFGAWAEQTGQPWALALSSRCAALLATEAEVDGHFRRALELHGRSGRPFDRARTEMQYGELLRRNRSRAQARVRLRSAWETFDRLGSGLWERRALAELRATGETVGLARSASATATLLTSQELRIARMVAAGATNRQVAAELFLSPRTVDYHLRKVFRRLGVTSRVELAHVDELR
ncbi:MAG: helix-turn-helix transcriptional regulator, partial [Pseudonocardiaceae bacterium]